MVGGSTRRRVAIASGARQGLALAIHMERWLIRCAANVRGAGVSVLKAKVLCNY